MTVNGTSFPFENMPKVMIFGSMANCVLIQIITARIECGIWQDNGAVSGLVWNSEVSYV